jgi:phosphate transport system substrate-binding protein
VDRQPGKSLDRRIKQLIGFLLSDEGQNIIARHSDEEDGYIPLGRKDVAVERQALEAL